MDLFQGCRAELELYPLGQQQKAFLHPLKRIWNKLNSKLPL